MSQIINCPGEPSGGGLLQLLAVGISCYDECDSTELEFGYYAELVNEYNLQKK